MAVPFHSRAASFDCKKARSDAEKLICSDPELSARDDELSQLYHRAKAAAADRKAFNAQNLRQWKLRESSCHDKACLQAWYADRKAQLEAQVADAGAAEPAAQKPCQHRDLTRADAARVSSEIDAYTQQHGYDTPTWEEAAGYEHSSVVAMVFGAELCGSTAAKTLDSLAAFTSALHDPTKRRIMECIGVDLYEGQPPPGHPPTREQCAVILRNAGLPMDVYAPPSRQ